MANKLLTGMDKTSNVVEFIAKHTNIISDQFPISIYQSKPLWLRAIVEELFYLLFNVYVDLLVTVQGDKGEDIFNKATNQWTLAMMDVLQMENTHQNRIFIIQKAKEKSINYTSIISNILNQKVNGVYDYEVEYKYQLYQQFLENITINLNDELGRTPKGGMEGSMQFIYLSQSIEMMRSEIFDEKSMIMLSLISNDTDERTEFDKFLTAKNQDKKGTRQRALIIRNGVVDFIDELIYLASHKSKKHHKTQDYRQSSSESSLNFFEGNLNPLQYFLSAIIPCFLILAINDSMYLFPPNISIPIFSMGTKIRELTSGQDFWLWVSYLLAVINLLYLQVKRLNDSGSNPALCLVSFIPFFGALFAVSLAMTNFFPRQNDDEDIENDPYVGISYAVSLFALFIFLIVWSGSYRMVGATL
ncbi:hypothetical protein [Moraxella equi]|uniref:Predicted membrane protein n=1 Tax=Moraxella equi TaxID=60442 RepID=A0A378QUX6_9GAMM|nr:hypothetical protein [Moraxella equi]OPH39001.1 hypothetical protein B5J93_04950 [Moraxella equi]STZ04667.1 Predicted membrane protein [Moraxella equi]